VQDGKEFRWPPAQAEKFNSVTDGEVKGEPCGLEREIGVLHGEKRRSRWGLGRLVLPKEGKRIVYGAPRAGAGDDPISSATSNGGGQTTSAMARARAAPTLCSLKKTRTLRKLES